MRQPEVPRTDARGYHAGQSSGAGLGPDQTPPEVGKNTWQPAPRTRDTCRVGRRNSFGRSRGGVALLRTERKAEKRLAEAKAVLASDEARLLKAQQRLERSREAVAAAEATLREVQERRAAGPRAIRTEPWSLRARLVDLWPPRSGPSTPPAHQTTSDVAGGNPRSPRRGSAAQRSRCPAG